MKKSLSLFLVMILLFSCIACGKTEPENNDSTTTTESTTESTFKSDTESTTVEESTTENTSEESATIIEENTRKAEKEDATKKNTTATEKPSSTKKPETTTTVKPDSKPTTTKPTTKPTTTKATTNATTPSVSVVTSNDIAKIKSGFLRLVNEERARKGVQSLSTNQTLNSAASSRSYEILNTFSHTRPNGTPFYTIIDENAYPNPQYTTGENIQMTSHMGSKPYTKNDMFVGREDQITAAYTTIFNNFKNSSGHYANMINGDFCNTGIGISYRIDSASGMAIFYIVQIFGA